VAAVTVVVCRNETAVPVFTRIAPGNAIDIRTAYRENRFVMVQSQEVVQPIAKKRHSAKSDGEKPSQQRFGGATYHRQASSEHGRVA
jgi:hypothetical protein